MQLQWEILSSISVIKCNCLEQVCPINTRSLYVVRFGETRRVWPGCGNLAIKDRFIIYYHFAVINGFLLQTCIDLRVKCVRRGDRDVYVFMTTIRRSRRDSRQQNTQHMRGGRRRCRGITRQTPRCTLIRLLQLWCLSTTNCPDLSRSSS